VLERRFLRLVAESGLPVPTSQVVFLDGEERFVARVDFLFEDLVIVEVEGHRFHSTRSQRQRDNERRNRLSRSEHRFLAFTYEDVRDRPRYVAREVRAALAAARRRAS
jgi:very-short-patch-repair endonuclease